MDKIGKRSWTKSKKDNPIVTELPKNNDKFKDTDVCKDVDILLYDDLGNPSFISIPSDSKEGDSKSEKDSLDKIFKIHYNDKLQQQAIVQVSKDTFDKFIQTHKKS
tara:strand:- start:119 stop:436 length:318 start_codon:yes stop_codon:yes gene_type:complete